MLVTLVAPTLYPTAEAQAQETTQCTLKRDQNRGPIPENIYYKSSDDSSHSIAGSRIEQAVRGWNGCKASTPEMHHATDENPAPKGARVWTIVRGTYDYFKVDLNRRNRCSDTEYGQPRTIRVYQDAPTNICGENGEYLHKSLMHEMGHTIGLHHITEVGPEHPDYANAQACRATKAMMTDVSLDVRELSEEVDCKFAHEFLRDDHPVDCAETPDHEDCTEDDDDDDDDGGGGGNPDIECSGTDAGGCRPDRDDDDDGTGACAFPAPGCPGYCDLNPFHRDCSPDCTLFPGDPRCGDVTWDVCWGRFEDTDGDGELECVPAAYLRVGGDGKDPVVITAASAPSRSYRIRLEHAGKLGVKLTGMKRDFDCKLYESAPLPSSDTPDAVRDSTSTWSCTNRGGARDDSLEKSLPAGIHTLSVYPFYGGRGDYTLTLSYAANPLPSPIARILPFTSEVTTSSSSTFRFTLAESAKVSVLISGMTADFDCRVGPKSKCSNNRGTLDDTWSGALGPATHSLTVFPHNGASGLFKLAVYRTGETPPSHDSDADGDEDEEDGNDDTGSDDDENEGEEEDEDTGGGDGEEDDGDTGDSEEDDGDTDEGEDDDDDEPEPTPEPDPTPAPTVDPPGAPTVRGSVVRQTQTVTWTEPATNGGAITRYQMAVRNSASHPWRWATAGSPSGSSNFAPTVRSWSVTTPAGLLRHYRVRATNSAGDGEWSAHVELRSETSPPPPPPPDPDPDPDPDPVPPPPAAKPGAPTLTASVARQTHRLSWTAAPSTIPITGYQMQTRNSSLHGWRFTSAGSPSPSSSFGPSVRSWRVTTPPGMHRQYRVRGRNASGYGSWSNVVSLTSAGGSDALDRLRGAGDNDDGDDDGDGRTDGCSDPSDPTVDDSLPPC